MTDVDFEGLRKTWISERPIYEEFASLIKETLNGELLRNGVRFTIDARAKEVGSLLKKALRDSEQDSASTARLGDKAGVRVIAYYLNDFEIIDRVIRNHLTVNSYDDKARAISADRLGYLGVHYQVSLPATPHSGPKSPFDGLECELQLHTRARNLWSDISHELDYKPAVPLAPEMRRRLYRLVALVELFDDQLSQVRSEMLSHTGYHEARLLNRLEGYFYQLTSKRFDRALSMEMIEKLLPAYTESELAAVATIWESFFNQNGTKLVRLFDHYTDSQSVSFLLYQPESLMIFERIDNSLDRLLQVWDAEYPRSLLVDLSTTWGKPVPDEFLG